MHTRDLLLEEHGRMHSAAITGDKATMAERTFGGLVTHSALHMGEAQTVRTAGGFGTGV